MLKEVIHHIDGSTAEVWPVDANEAIRTHPHEWSREPWTEAQRRKVRMDQQASA